MIDDKSNDNLEKETRLLFVKGDVVSKVVDKSSGTCTPIEKQSGDLILIFSFVIDKLVDWYFLCVFNYFGSLYPSNNFSSTKDIFLFDIILILF